MAESAELQAEILVLRKQLADANVDAERRVEAVKTQLQEAKIKAKALIQRSVAAEKIRFNQLQEQNDLNATELKELKQILRQSDDAKLQHIAVSKTLNQQLEAANANLAQTDLENNNLQSTLENLRNALEEASNAAAHDRDALSMYRDESKQHLLEAKNQYDLLLKSTLAQSSSLEPCNAETSAVSELTEELNRAKEGIITLQSTCDLLKKENEVLKQSNMSATTDSPCVHSENAASNHEALQREVEIVKERAESLSNDLENAHKDMREKDVKYKIALEKLASEKAAVEQDFSVSEANLTQLRSDFQKSEYALQQERENLIQASNKASKSSDTDVEGRKMLEAKIAEMERVVASKQSEIGRVREKARTYLKELNAEKRDMEANMKKEVEALQTQMEEERSKVKNMEQRAECAASELDNCLTLIREKQNTIQMLRMTISSQKSAADDAVRETESVRRDFSRYKDRARIALQEKENNSKSVKASVEAATVSLTLELERVKKRCRDLQQQLAGVEKNQESYQEVLQRAERAEAAADLLRENATNGSTMHYGQVDVLEERLVVMENELSAALSATKDAESSLKTCKMRLEAAERALRAVEVRAEENERVSKRTVEGLTTQVDDLKAGLAQAEQSALAAQRTAAVAAKALAFSSPTDTEDDHDLKEIDNKILFDSTSLMENEVHSRYNNNRSLEGGRASLAVAIEDHSESLGLGRRSNDLEGTHIASETELKERDQQITVLMAQVRELGALLDEQQQESQLRSEQSALLKVEVKNLDAKLAAAEKLQNGAPFSYLRTIVVRYLETDDSTLLPVIANVLSFTEEESSRVKEKQAVKSSGTALPGASPKVGYFSLPFLGSR